MGVWVGSPYIPVDPHVVARMKSFSSSVTSPKSMSALAKKIAVSIDNKVDSIKSLTIAVFNPISGAGTNLPSSIKR
jgi:hypothetical protein